MNFLEEIKRRRTFGIVSHPDAGKTTLTEKLLLFGGAIHVAGAVKNNKIKKGATSDFMEIERQRGISVATSVMGFEYDNYKINILDTPGHQDFQEDTFRTLTAVDSVIIVIDAAKGVEPQTEKLMNVCRMRKTPVIVFVNKMDRPAQDPFSLMDEIENQLKITVRPLSWPINNGPDFKGVYNIFNKSLKLFSPDIQKIEERIKFENLSDPALEDYIGKDAEVLREELELVEGVYPEFKDESYHAGDLAPVFFGSALYNFGVQELLEAFVQIAPSPKPSKSEEREVKPEENGFSGFVFKIHANIDPNHRSRIAFLKICSGKFERNKMYKNIRLDKTFRISSPTAFMAAQKEIVEEAFPGDIIGVPDTGNFIIGDTLTDGEVIHFKGLP
ncbi:MAG: peptide chain release factor 3, partial [Prolixibacteraceae bacterium]